MVHVPLGPGPEFDRIRGIVQALGATARGIGGDCAELGDGRVASTDTSLEGRHFRRGWLTRPELGWRAAAAALSDLAAVGATEPRLLVAVEAPADAGPDDLAEVMRGVGEAAAHVGGAVVGGDLVRGERWSLTVTVLGRAARRLGRDGARPGDALWVTGDLGGARRALQAWLAGEQPAPAARARFARPLPRLAAGAWLAAHGATAAIDLSDGLASDVRHLAAASRVRIVVDVDRLPLGPAITDPADAAIGGEDYELLVTLPPAFGDDEARACHAATGAPLRRIGRVEVGAGAVLDRAGTPLALEGFDHYR